MPSFRYRAYNMDGRLAEGTLDATTADAAKDALWAQGLTSFQIQVVGAAGGKWWNREISFGGDSSRTLLLDFTRQFATLNAAEIPLDDALRILGESIDYSRQGQLVLQKMATTVRR